MRACARAHKIPYILLCNFFSLSRARAHKTPYILPCKFFSLARARAHKTTYILRCKCFSRMPTNNVKHSAHKCARACAHARAHCRHNVKHSAHKCARARILKISRPAPPQKKKTILWDESKTINEWAKLLKMQQTKKRFWNAKRLKRGIIKKAKKAADILNKFCHGRKARKRSNPFPSFCLLFFFLKKRVEQKKTTPFNAWVEKRKLFLVCPFFCFLSDVCFFWVLATFWFLTTPVKFVIFVHQNSAR